MSAQLQFKCQNLHIKFKSILLSEEVNCGICLYFIEMNDKKI